MLYKGKGKGTANSVEQGEESEQAAMNLGGESDQQDPNQECKAQIEIETAQQH